jgi:hypothetical protein
MGARRYCATPARIAMTVPEGGYGRQAMSSTTGILLVILASVIVSFAIAAAVVRAARARADAALADLGTPLRTAAASALGRTGADMESMTGTGTLVLTAEELGFAQWRPARLLRIRRADILRTDTTREHLGKSMKNDVLRLTWRGDGNVEESVAFFVRDLDPWLADLGGHRSTAAE